MENEYVITVDLKNTKDESRRKVIEFTCSSGYHDPVNEAYGPATDAFFCGTVSQKMLKDWYGLTPLNKPAVLVHYGDKVDNAFWFKSAVMIGDGFESFYPLCNLDTLAHELGHGVTETYSDLVYEKQSGGMNEAFSDIMGESAEEFFSTTDWLSGFQDTKDPIRPLRYFDKPSRDGQSIDHANQYKADLNVHLSSGVYNRAFYQIVKVGGVKMRYGFEAYLTANRVYWNSNSNFVSGACGVIRAAYTLGLDTEKFKAGFSVVGISTCDLTSYLRMLTTSQSQSNIKVSRIRQPVFGVTLTASVSSITVTTTGGSGIKVAISTSLSRDSSLANGAGSVTWATGGTTGIVYVRLFTDSETGQTGVSVSLSMN
ncbi:elastase-like [Gigantopelta aegis]|uniref:elastase-like n=1 Tax=Gigantopelta aegis TaxID=1735272 RepID=UPI001B889A3E|nr:elastase-like [Gigantopelta aegis]